MPTAAVPMFIRNFSPPFPVGYNTHDSAGAFIQPTGKLPQMPMLAFIDRQGVIRAQAEGEEPFFNDLEAEPAQRDRRAVPGRRSGEEERGAVGRQRAGVPQHVSGVLPPGTGRGIGGLGGASSAE